MSKKATIALAAVVALWWLFFRRGASATKRPHAGAGDGFSSVVFGGGGGGGGLVLPPDSGVTVPEGPVQQPGPVETDDPIIGGFGTAPVEYQQAYKNDPYLGGTQSLSADDPFRGLEGAFASADAGGDFSTLRLPPPPSPGVSQPVSEPAPTLSGVTAFGGFTVLGPTAPADSQIDTALGGVQLADYSSAALYESKFTQPTASSSDPEPAPTTTTNVATGLKSGSSGGGLFA